MVIFTANPYKSIEYYSIFLSFFKSDLSKYHNTIIFLYIYSNF